MRLQIPGTEWVGGEIPSSPEPVRSLPIRVTELGDDPQLVEEVREALLLHSGIDDGAIEVRVQDRIATLRGRVPNARMSQLAEEIADRNPGILAVRNELRVEGH